MNTQEFINKWTDHPGEREVIARDIEAIVADQLAALTAERDGLLEALVEIAYRVKPRGLLARWLVGRAQRALNEPTNQPTTTGEHE